MVRRSLETFNLEDEVTSNYPLSVALEPNNRVSRASVIFKNNHRHVTNRRELSPRSLGEPLGRTLPPHSARGDLLKSPLARSGVASQTLIGSSHQSTCTSPDERAAASRERF